MSTLGVIALVAWLVGGLPVGIAWAIYLQRHPDEWEEALPPGLVALMGWAFAPLILAGALLAGVCWVLGRVVGRVERARPTRETLEARIRELEDETGVGS